MGAVLRALLESSHKIYVARPRMTRPLSASAPDYASLKFAQMRRWAVEARDQAPWSSKLCCRVFNKSLYDGPMFLIAVVSYTSNINPT